MKEHHQAYAAACLTAGEFVAGLWLVIHEGHFLALYLAITYLSRETAGGKHYHHVFANWINKIRTEKQCQKACDSIKSPVLGNPFKEHA
jgi:hypothetical protein